MRLIQTHTRGALTLSATFKLLKARPALFCAGLVCAALLLSQLPSAIVRAYYAPAAPAVAQAPVVCLVACPANITVPATAGLCSATVNYAAPTTTGVCGAVICTPASGSTFNLGTTTVTCRAPNQTACNTAYALTTSNALISFDTTTPGTTTVPVVIAGLGAGENIVGIDFRPANGLLYGVAVSGTTARLLTINPTNGATTQVGATFVVSGSFFGVDFNPMADRLRLVSDSDINLSINPNDGAATTQTPLNPGDPRVVGSAYTNNFAGATSTTLYAIDSGANTLRTQSPPASGTLSAGLALGVDPLEDLGFDISQCTGTAYATLNVGGSSGLYTINLMTGAATLVGAIGGGTPIRGLALGLTAPATQPMCSFTVTVNDTQAPVITCPANITVGSSVAFGTAVNYPPPTVSDNCPNLTVVCTPASGSNFPLGANTVTCTATDASSNTASCSFNVTVNRVSFSVTDPLTCTGPGGVVTGTFTVTNNGAVATSVAATVSLPTGLFGLPGSSTATVGTASVVNSQTIAFTAATLAPGQTATVSYQAQVGDVPSGTVLTSNLAVSFGGGPTLNVSAQTTVTCPAPGPGGLFPSTSEVSDQKAGSVLIYNYYSSTAGTVGQDTRLSITNTDPTVAIGVHVFFIDGATCSVADAFICLTPNQTATLLASDLDPGTSGYIVAIASDVNTGCPISFNRLIGDEFIKLSSGHTANLGAEAFAALPGGLTFCDPNTVTATLSFDGISYNRAPRVLALDSLADNASGNNTLLVINRISGNLAIGADRLSTLFGILYDDQEIGFSFSLPGGVCQLRGTLSNSFPRTAPPMGQVIPAGRTGWLKIYDSTDAGILGAALVFNPNTGASGGAFSGGHNLHKLRLTAASSFTIPIFPPNC